MQETITNAAMGFVAMLVSGYMLFQNYFGEKYRLTFRAGCYMWLLLFFGISMICVGISDVTKLIFSNW